MVSPKVPISMTTSLPKTELSAPLPEERFDVVDAAEWSERVGGFVFQTTGCVTVVRPIDD